MTEVKLELVLMRAEAKPIKRLDTDKEVSEPIRTAVVTIQRLHPQPLNDIGERKEK